MNLFTTGEVAQPTTKNAIKNATKVKKPSFFIQKSPCVLSRRQILHSLYSEYNI
jgi:TPP-dependent indolepyruvate ferredoxin oxidoreductase alpha subunit